MGEVYRAHASSPYRSEDLVSTEACSRAEGHRRNLLVRMSRFNRTDAVIGRGSFFSRPDVTM